MKIDQKVHLFRGVLIQLMYTYRLARAGPRSEPTTYESISFNGSFRRADSAPRSTRSTNYPAGLQMLRRPRCGRDDSIPLNSIGGNDIVSVANLNFAYSNELRIDIANDGKNFAPNQIDFDCDGPHC